MNESIKAKILMVGMSLGFVSLGHAAAVQKFQPDERDWGVKVARHVVQRAVVLDPKRELLRESSIQYPTRSKTAIEVVKDTVFSTKEGSACTMDVKPAKKLWVVKASCHDRKNNLRVISVKLAQNEMLALR